MSTFVSVGNAKQPFQRLLDAVARLAPRLPQPVIVQHGHTPFAATGCQAVEFLAMEDFARYVSNASLLILHAGAGSVIHAIEAGRCPVVMPRRSAEGEHVNDHQVEFAHCLGAAGKVIVADEPEALEKAIARAMSLPVDSANTHAEPRLVGLVRDALVEYARQLDG